MNYGLLKRAYLVSRGFAFEAVDSEEFGKRIIKVTDCEDERNTAIYMVYKAALREKASFFCDEKRYDEFLETIRVNKEFVLGGYYGD